jgi:hypothetical protein
MDELMADRGSKVACGTICDSLPGADAFTADTILGGGSEDAGNDDQEAGESCSSCRVCQCYCMRATAWQARRVLIDRWLVSLQKRATIYRSAPSKCLPFHMAMGPWRPPLGPWQQVSRGGNP